MSRQETPPGLRRRNPRDQISYQRSSDSRAIRTHSDVRVIHARKRRFRRVRSLLYFRSDRRCSRAVFVMTSVTQ